MDQLFSTEQACNLSGATYRQADHAARIGVLTPTVDANGSGSQRRYSVREVQALWAITQLARMGQLDARVRRFAAAELRRADDFSGWLVVLPNRAVIVPHVLALADLVADVECAALTLNLDGCPVLDRLAVTREVVSR